MKRTITFLVYPHYELLDLSGPVSAFNLANEMYGAGYRIEVASLDGGRVPERAGMIIETKRYATLEQSETILVVGGPTAPQHRADSPTVSLLCEAARGANRVASVCTGAFLLCAAGLLDGRRATTHWRFAGMLQEHYPKVRVDADRIFIKDGILWTSAGLTAGIDIALALIEEDFDSKVAKGVAKDMVVHHQRPGGQSQFSAMLDMEPAPGPIRKALSHARDHLSEPLTVELLADVACLSPRQFSRRFLNATGNTPIKAIELLRLEAARPRIEDEAESLETVARAVGFGTMENMRRSCTRIYGRTPLELRRAGRQNRRFPAG